MTGLKKIQVGIMNHRGWMAWFVTLIFMAMFCFAVLAFFAGLSLFLSMGLFHNTEAEQKSITPFLIVHVISNMSIDDKPFFQEMSYVASGQLIDPKFESDVQRVAKIMANAYKISMYSRGLASISFGMISEEYVSGAVIPIFTFYKNAERMLVTAS
jgi:hypothetical protein